jgi:hypothetical protein
MSISRRSGPFKDSHVSLSRVGDEKSAHFDIVAPHILGRRDDRKTVVAAEFATYVENVKPRSACPHGR